MKRFYSNNITTSHAILEGKEKEHCVRVLRVKEGEEVEIVDGKGSVFVGELMQVNKKEAVVEIRKQTEHELENSNHLTIASCVPKNSSRWEWFLEKATEVGVERFMPLISSRSEKKNIRRERSEHIILSAFKQSGQLFLPKLEDPIAFNDLLDSDTHLRAQKFVAHCGHEDKVHLANRYVKGNDAIILIGPEGDFTLEEISAAKEKGYFPVSLGDSRLRVETAGVVSAGIINWINAI